MKSYTGLVTIPTIAASKAQQDFRVKASSFPVAASRALADVMSRPGVKGKRFDSVTVRISCIGKVEE